MARDRTDPPRAPERIFPLTRFNGERPEAPAWFGRALAAPHEDGVVDVAGAPIRWRRWTSPTRSKDAQGILFVHGGLAHLGWWDFIAPWFAETHAPAALSLSGMGGSGWRDSYVMETYAEEAVAAAEAAGLFDSPWPPLIVGHSFGGFVSLAVAMAHGRRFAGAVIADSPIRPDGVDGPPRAEPRRRGGSIYPNEAAALARFSLLPNQDCPNLYVIDHIARGALQPATDADGAPGVAWVHDPELWIKRQVSAVSPAQAIGRAACPLAFVRGEGSVLVTDELWAGLPALAGPDAPLVSLPEAEHHLTLDQPLAFVSTLRALLATWPR